MDKVDQSQEPLHEKEQTRSLQMERREKGEENKKPMDTSAVQKQW